VRTAGAKANLYQAERGIVQPTAIAGLPDEKWNFQGTFGEGAPEKLIAYAERITSQENKLILHLAIAQPKGVLLEEAGTVFVVRADAFKPDTVQIRGGEPQGPKEEKPAAAPAPDAKDKPAEPAPGIWEKLHTGDCMLFGSDADLRIELKAPDSLGWFPRQTPFWGANCYQVHVPAKLPKQVADAVEPVRFRVEIAVTAAPPRPDPKKPQGGTQK
jgi:hypothetical protein